MPPPTLKKETADSSEEPVKTMAAHGGLRQPLPSHPLLQSVLFVVKQNVNLPMFKHHTVKSHNEYGGAAHSPSAVSMERNSSFLSQATRFLLCISLITETDGPKSATKESGYQALCKANPLQALTGPEGSRKLSFPDFMTTAQDGGKAFSLTHRPPLPPGNAPGTHFC